MVLVTIGLASSEGGMDGSGDAVSDQSADEREKWDPLATGYTLDIWGVTHVLAPSLLSQCSFPWPSRLHFLQACLKRQSSVLFLHPLIELKRLHISVLLDLLVVRFEVARVCSDSTPSGMTMAE